MVQGSYPGSPFRPSSLSWSWLPGNTSTFFASTNPERADDFLMQLLLTALPSALPARHYLDLRISNEPSFTLCHILDSRIVCEVPPSSPPLSRQVMLEGHAQHSKAFSKEIVSFPIFLALLPWSFVRPSKYGLKSPKMTFWTPLLQILGKKIKDQQPYVYLT